MSNTFKGLESQFKTADDVETYMSFLLNKGEKYLNKNSNYNFLFKNFYLINRLLPFIEEERTKVFYNQLYNFLKFNEDEYFKEFLSDERIVDENIKAKETKEWAYEKIIYDILLYYNLYRIFSSRIFGLSNEQLDELISLYFDYVNKDESMLFYSDYKINDVDELGSYIFDERLSGVLERYDKRRRYELMSEISLDYFDLKSMGDVIINFPDFACELLNQAAKDEIASIEKEKKKRIIESTYDVYCYFKDFIEWMVAHSTFDNNGDTIDEMIEYTDDLSFLENLSLGDDDTNSFLSYSKEIIDKESMTLIEKFKLIVNKAIDMKSKRK